ncbi:MAG: RadC family protein [Janthinobacterium lividum]
MQIDETHPGLAGDTSATGLSVAPPALSPSSAPLPTPSLIPPPGSAAGILQWPAAERPRERMLAAGPQALSEAELLAIFLRTGSQGRSAVDVGRDLLSRFGSLRALLAADINELSATHGVGTAKAAQLCAIGEIARRALHEDLKTGALLASPSAVRDYLRLMIGARPQEVFVTLFLDAHYRLLAAEESSRGTQTRTSVYPREIVRRALALNAASLIVGHNHPSGLSQPSEADKLLTRRLHASLELFEIQLLDHFVVASNTLFSFAEHGWLH